MPYDTDMNKILRASLDSVFLILLHFSNFQCFYSVSMAELFLPKGAYTEIPQVYSLRSSQYLFLRTEFSATDREILRCGVVIICLFI